MTQEEFKDDAARLRGRLTAAAQRLLHDPDEAEDVVQDVLLKLWQMRAELRRPVDGMALVLVRHACVGLLRRRQRWQALFRSRSDVAAGPEDHADASPDVEHVMRIVATLPDTQQTILRMRHIDGLTMGDIAELTGTTEVAVRKSLSRARKTVRLRYLRTLSAVFVLVAVLAATVWLSRRSDCEIYVYGKRYTNEEMVRREMQLVVGEVSDGQTSVDELLNDMFSVN